jgi:hypothetical protein
MATTSRRECAACSTIVPAGELSAHGGFCAECHEDATDDAESLLEIRPDFNYSVEEMTDIILAYRNMTACAYAIQRGLNRRDRLPPPWPRLHLTE